MTTAFDSGRADIFTNLGFSNESYNGNFQWTESTPSGAVISAVIDMPVVGPDLWNVDLTTNQTALALQAVVTGEQWESFAAWHHLSWRTACANSLTSNLHILDIVEALCNCRGMSDMRSACQIAMADNNLTRLPI